MKRTRRKMVSALAAVLAAGGVSLVAGPAANAVPAGGTAPPTTAPPTTLSCTTSENGYTIPDFPGPPHADVTGTSFASGRHVGLTNTYLTALHNGPVEIYGWDANGFVDGTMTDTVDLTIVGHNTVEHTQTVHGTITQPVPARMPATTPPDPTTFHVPRLNNSIWTPAGPGHVGFTVSAVTLTEAYTWDQSQTPGELPASLTVKCTNSDPSPAAGATPEFAGVDPIPVCAPLTAFTGDQVFAWIRNVVTGACLLFPPALSVGPFRPQPTFPAMTPLNLAAAL